MSSSTVPQILQIAAPRPDGIVQQTTDSQGQEFQRLLAQASGGSAPRNTAPTDTDRVQGAEQSRTDQSEQDSTSPDDPPTAVIPVESGEATIEEVSTEQTTDAVELSEAAELAIATQIATTADYPVASLESLPDSDHPSTVIKVSTAADRISETNEKPEIAIYEYTVTLEVSPTTEQVDAAEPVSVVELERSPPAEAATAERQSALETAFEATEELAAKLPTEVSTSQVVVTEQTVQAAVQPRLEIERATPVAPAQPPKANPTLTEPKNSPLTEEAYVATEGDESLEKPAKAAPIVVAAVQQETFDTDEAKAVVEEEAAPATRAPESLPAKHTPVENTASETRLTSFRETVAEHQQIPEESDPLPTLDRARFVQRVSRAFQSAHSREGVIQLRLSPPELGSLRIEISTQQGVISAKVETETAAARNVMLDNLPALRERLAEQQIRLEKFDVDVRREGGQEPGNWSEAGRQPRRSTDNFQTNRVRPTVSPVVRAAAPLGGVTDAGLDVRI